jgi:hypothetical protein
MARRIEHRAHSGWDVTTVYRTLVDPDYLRAQLAAVGGRNAALVEHEVTEKGVRYRLRHGVAGEDLPGVVRRVLGGDISVDRQETWRVDPAGGYSGTVRVAIPGTPGEMTGTMRLAAVGEGSERSVDGSVRIGIPLVGGMVEETVARQVNDLLAAESEFTEDWLRKREA